LLVYGVTTFVKKEAKESNENETKINPKRGYISLFIKGFLLNFINIGVLVFWLGIIIVVSPSLNNDSSRVVTFFGSMILAYFITDIFKILLAKQLKRKLTTRRIFMVKKSLGVILIIFGIILIIKGLLPKNKFNIEKGIQKIERIRE